MSNQVRVQSKVDYSVGLIIPEYRVKKIFTQAEQIALVDKEALKEGLYLYGVKTLFSEGILYVMDTEDRIELGLEVPDEIPQIIMNPSQMAAFLVTSSLSDFKEKINRMSNEQINSLVKIAIEKKYTDFEKAEFLKSKTGRDVLKTVSLLNENDEAES